MRFNRARGLPIFWQTILLLLTSFIVSQAIFFALVLTSKPPRPDFNRLSEIAEVLSGEEHEHGGRDKALATALLPTPPVAAEGMTSDPAFTGRLAAYLRVDPARVRLYFEPDQRSGDVFNRRWRHGMVPMRRGEPLFFDTVIAGVDTGSGWRVVQTPPRPFIGPWQRRLLLWIAISALVMLPFAWFFARRLTRPIRRFAEAADRLGADPLAPPLKEEGPAELRVTAHALNRMQQRLADYIAERTAMIGAIAHDLRTPLARIAFRIEAAPDEVREKVQSDIDQMRAMISETIGFVKGASRPAERQRLDLRALLAEIVRQEIEMGWAVGIDAPVPAVILGDPIALARLFQNLIDNGLAYGKAVKVGLGIDQGRALVTIADEGPGLAEGLLEKVFQPFERGDPSRNRETGGIGLGLTIARTIAEDHGGTLSLRNRAEGGLEARCAFPLA